MQDNNKTLPDTAHQDETHNERRKEQAANVPENRVEMLSWKEHLIISFRFILIWIIICAIAYPAAITLASQALWEDNAQGGLVTVDGVVVGAELIGQTFTSEQFFHPRPSSTGYDGMDSGSQNLGPTNEKLTQRVEQDLAALEQAGIDPATVPVVWVTESGSSLDPHITPEAARLQIPRISQATGLAPDTLDALIVEHTEGKFMSLFGWERVNVLRLNIEIQKRLENPDE